MEGGDQGKGGERTGLGGMYRLEQLKETPRPRKHALGGEQHDDITLLHAIGEESAQVGEGH